MEIKINLKFLAVSMIIMGSIMAGCMEVKNTLAPRETRITPEKTSPGSGSASEATPTLDIKEYAFPDEIDPARLYLFYIHGRIVEEQGIPAVDPVLGEYQYQAILQLFAREGFVVISEQREKNTDPIEYAKRVQQQVTRLLNASVPAANITVLGASKGAYITLYVSHFLANPEIKIIPMGICNPEIISDLQQNRVVLYGRVLSIYDSADTEYAGSCGELFSMSEAEGGTTRHEEIVLKTGKGHGILYQPLDEWVQPVLHWSREP